MNTYKCARELEGTCLQEKDLIIFSDVGGFTVERNTSGWYLSGIGVANDAMFTYLYGFKTSANEQIKKLGDYPVVGEGIFPYLKTDEALTEVVSKLFLEVERKRFREFDFRRYVPKGGIVALSKDNISKLCKNQVEQENVFDIEVFERYWCATREMGGMTWEKSLEKEPYWKAILFSTPLNVAASTISDTPLKETAKSSDKKEVTQSFSSLATLSVRRTQKPKLKTL